MFVEVEIVIRALDVGDHGELGGCQFGQGDFDVLFGRLAAEAEGAEPGKLLRDEYVVGVVAHERVLRRHARDRVDGVRDDRVVKCGDLRNASLQRQEVEARGLDGPVLTQSLPDIGIDRLRAEEVGRRRGGVQHRGVGVLRADRLRGPVCGVTEVLHDLGVFRPRGWLDTAGDPEQDGCPHTSNPTSLHYLSPESRCRTAISERAAAAKPRD